MAFAPMSGGSNACRGDTRRQAFSHPHPVRRPAPQTVLLFSGGRREFMLGQQAPAMLTISETIRDLLYF
jgi:hypothetical protein